jgi:hypothetical protein
MAPPWRDVFLEQISLRDRCHQLLISVSDNRNKTTKEGKEQ